MAARLTRNLLGVEITSKDVANAVVAFCTDTFRATTGPQVPIDGGNERVVQARGLRRLA